MAPAAQLGLPTLPTPANQQLNNKKACSYRARQYNTAGSYSARQYLWDVAVPQQLHAKAVLVVPAGQVRRRKCGWAGAAGQVRLGSMSDAVAPGTPSAFKQNKQPHSRKCNSWA